MMDNPDHPDWVFHSYWFDNMAAFRKPVGIGPIPDNAEEMLAWQYGQNWRTPMRLEHSAWATSDEYARLRARYEIKEKDQYPWTPPVEWASL